jgi:hypothetical protein
MTLRTCCESERVSGCTGAGCYLAGDAESRRSMAVAEEKT